MRAFKQWRLGNVIVALAMATCLGCKNICTSNLKTGLPVIVCQPEDHSLLHVGDSAALTVKAVGPELDYQWFKLLPDPDTGRSIEWPIPGATNCVLKFRTVRESDYGLYFCEIKSHPNYDLVQESRTRFIVLSGPAVATTKLYSAQKGIVRSGSAGANPCNVVHSGYVKFPDSGTGYVPDPNTTTCITWLESSTGTRFTTSQYKLSYLSKNPFVTRCATASGTNTYFFASSPANSNAYMFTAYFLGNNAPPAGSHVTLNILWR